MMRRPPFVSVIIPTYQRERVLCETLDSLLKQTYPDFEVIVLDQSRSHSPETAQYLAEFTSRANCFVATEDTPGLPRARTLGFLRSRGDIVLYLDDDVELPPGFIEAHIRCFDDEKIAAVAGRILLPGEDPSAARPLSIPAEAASDRIDVQVVRSTTRVKNPLHVGGGNLSVRRCWMERSNGFSCRMRGSALGEDLEFTGRLRRLGGLIHYEPDAWLIHRVEVSGGCRADHFTAFKLGHNRMANLYFAIFHGAGWRLGVSLWLRRLYNGLTRTKAQSSSPTPTAKRQSFMARVAGMAGRFVGAVTGVYRSLPFHDDWTGSLGQLQQKGMTSHRRDEATIAVIKIPAALDVRALNAAAQRADADVLLFVCDPMIASPDQVLAHAKYYNDFRNWCARSESALSIRRDVFLMLGSFRDNKPNVIDDLVRRVCAAGRIVGNL